MEGNITKICVIGAGVNGLSTALLILETIPNVSVTIIADKITTETLSDGAPGLFRPTDSLRGPHEDSIKIWSRDSYAYYKSIASSAMASNAGIKEISGYMLAKENEELLKNKLLENMLPMWRRMNDEEINSFPGNWEFGCNCKTVLVECRRYLPWMMNRFQQNGGKILKKTIQSFEEVAYEYDLIVNCSGLSAKYLCGDKRVIPIRGQAFKVKAPWLKEFVYGSSDFYIVPGFDFVTLGGTRQFYSYDTNINSYNSKEIWDRCCELVPSLKDAKIEYEFVGLRPYRDVIRVELEYLKRKNNGISYPVVHNYGHGGSGVALSYGCAKNAVQLVKSALEIKTVKTKL